MTAKDIREGMTVSHPWIKGGPFEVEHVRAMPLGSVEVWIRVNGASLGQVTFYGRDSRFRPE